MLQHSLGHAAQNPATNPRPAMGAHDDEIIRGVSALGVEEQRVNVIADFVEPPGALGDGYRVEAKIIIWSAEAVLRVPVSALFRKGEAWSVFVVEDSRAKQREVKIGQLGDLEAEVLQGLKAGETVIRHPSNDIADGTRVKVR